MTAMELVLAPGGVASASAFFKAGSDLLYLLDEVSDVPVEWVISGLRVGSAVAYVSAPEDQREVGDDALFEVAVGLSQVRQEGEALPNWTPDAIAAATNLARELRPRDSRQRPSYLRVVRDAERPPEPEGAEHEDVEPRWSLVPFEASLIQQLDELRPVVRQMPGSVRGRLVGFSVARGNRASIRPQRGRVIRASFDSALREELKAALLQDVELVGTVKQDGQGNVFHVRVSAVETLTPAGVQWADLLGMDPDFTGDLGITEFLDRSRGEA